MSFKRYHLNKFQILNHAENTIADIVEACRNMDDYMFFYKSEQWSVAENLEHLSLVLSKSWISLLLPKFLIRWKFGKPLRNSLPYEELEYEYNKKLEDGYHTEQSLIPVVKEKSNREKMIARFENASKKYLDQLRYYWEDENIDNFTVPHHALGMITIRELLYFNLFHNTHHYKVIRNRKNEAIEFSVAD